jgi:alginate O-acetyltransferase complex protein AlgJ
MTKTEPSPSTAPVPPSALALRASPVAGVAFLMFMIGGLASSSWLAWHQHVELLPPTLTTEAILEGDVTHRIARELSKAPLPVGAANLERGASWLLLEDSGPRVRQGCPGWLFLTDELKLNRHAEKNANAKADAVIRLNRQLATRGITLLVSVVPDKSRIATSALCDLHRPPVLQQRLRQWTVALQAAGVAALDLTSALQPLGEQAFLRTDTHWSEPGARAAAQAVAAQVRNMGLQASPRKRFAVNSPEARPRAGDLVRLAGLDWLPQTLQPPGEQTVQSVISEAPATPNEEADSLDDLFGDANLPNTALIGTSFSRNSNFAGFLEVALGASIGNFAKDGGEFSGAAKAYFASPAYLQTPPKVLIWEIPERELQTPYAGDLPVR